MAGFTTTARLSLFVWSCGRHEYVPRTLGSTVPETVRRSKNSVLNVPGMCEWHSTTSFSCASSEGIPPCFMVSMSCSWQPLACIACSCSYDVVDLVGDLVAQHANVETLREVRAPLGSGMVRRSSRAVHVLLLCVLILIMTRLHVDVAQAARPASVLYFACRIFNVVGMSATAAFTELKQDYDLLHIFSTVRGFETLVFNV